jgi:hypothetical protein
MRRRHAALVFGGLWMAGGVALLHRGTALLEIASNQIAQQSCMLWLVGWGIHVQEALVVCVAVALVLGMIKGRTVLAKTAERHLTYLAAQPEPLSWYKAVPSSALALLVLMLVLGKSLALWAPADIRGVLLVAVGTGLLIGGMQLMRGSRAAMEVGAPS